MPVAPDVRALRVSAARAALAELRATDPSVSGHSYAYWVGRLEVILESLIELAEDAS